ncbi:hypothetical protein LOD99_2811 [Oopsacas minuta]|uniref:Uncharacterized protein n=1 Tax=Oopsacas minuta TaxID=111878 RepID=A0AAV7K138_9METZ|nr:hypothetical protein LOD99_2811 [Oopsacas minuta]
MYVMYYLFCRYNQSNRDRFQRDISESFYQDYTGGRMGGIGAGISTKGWGTYHGRDWYMGNALCNLAHDPAAPHGVEKSELLRSISRTYSRSLPRSRSASGTRERIWSTNILEDSKKAVSRPRSQSAKSLSKRGK